MLHIAWQEDNCDLKQGFFGVDSHVTNCDNMFLNYDNSINKIRKMSTNATANCVEDEEEKERSSTLSNNFKEL